MNAQASEVERRRRRPIMSSFHALFSLGGLTGSGVVAAAMAVGVRRRPALRDHRAGGVPGHPGGVPHLCPPVARQTRPGLAFTVPPVSLLGLGGAGVCGVAV